MKYKLFIILILAIYVIFLIFRLINSNIRFKLANYLFNKPNKIILTFLFEFYFDVFRIISNLYLYF